jgi:hypothetical protein
MHCVGGNLCEIGTFGATAGFALFSATSFMVLFLTGSSALDKILRMKFFRAIFGVLGYGLFLVIVPLFGVGVIASAHNLILATKHCFIGSDAELASRLHQRIELVGVFDDWHITVSGWIKH